MPKTGTTLPLDRRGGATASPVAVLLELPSAIGWSNKAAEGAATDDFIDTAVRRATSRLVIVVRRRPDDDLPDDQRAVCQLLCRVYTSAWEAMSAAGKYDLDVRVLVLPHGDERPLPWSFEVVMAERPTLVQQTTCGFAELHALAPDLARRAALTQDLPLWVLPSLVRRGWQQAAGLLRRVSPLRRGPGTSPPPLIFLDDPCGGAAVRPLKRVAVGGTFDRLHLGHKKLLSLAAALCEDTLIVGVTSESMLAKKDRAAAIEPLAARQLNVADFLAHVSDPPRHVEPVVLFDMLGPVATDPDLDALLLSSESLSVLPMIHEARASRGLKPIQILVCRRTHRATLSSTFLRRQADEALARQKPPSEGCLDLPPGPPPTANAATGPIAAAAAAAASAA